MKICFIFVPDVIAMEKIKWRNHWSSPCNAVQCWKNYTICYIEMCVAFQEVKLFWSYWGQPTFTPLNVRLRGTDRCAAASWFPEGFFCTLVMSLSILKTSRGKTAPCIICLVLLPSLLKLLISAPNFASAGISFKQMASSFSVILIITKDTPQVFCTLGVWQVFKPTLNSF